jgi:DNA-binding MarR family transcriptional regulator
MTANHGDTGTRAAAETAAAADAADVDGAAGIRTAAGTVDLEELGRAVKEAQYRHHRTLDTRLAAVGTTLAQWDALRAIARTPGASAHELAVATFQGDQSFGTLASRLAAQHLIERRPGHGRRIEHHLTEAGERVLAAGRAVTRDVLAASFGPLDEVERATLLGLLRRIGSPGEAL